MLLLALDTATPAVTVALHDGTDVVASSCQVDARRSTESCCCLAVDRVLAEAGLALEAVTGIVVGVGPGPYTGLRVGLMTADTFGLALGVPVHGVCTLDGLAYAADIEKGPFVVATDARRKEVYWATYADSRTRLTDPAVDRLYRHRRAGRGAARGRRGSPALPGHVPARSRTRARLRRRARRAGRREARRGRGTARPRPLYLRRPDAQVPKNYKVVTPK
ncbi:tRNA (adenosine(37)-N6)-threonylcarbamoyltransferase complex dimerization subunit type 1 TsaB [Streptomyces lasalocidi]